MSHKQLFMVAAMSIMAGIFSEVSFAQINTADPDTAQKQFSQPSLPQDSSSNVQQQSITQASPSAGSGTAAGESSPVKAQEKNGLPLLIAFPLLVLVGLCFAMFMGRRRAVDGFMSTPTPGSKESPAVGKPKKEKSQSK